MREIKFRAIDKKCNKFVYGTDYNIVFPMQDTYNISAFFRQLDITIKRDTLSQYTGLKDKNNVDIFEGDIVKWGMDKQELSGVRYGVVNIDLLNGTNFYVFKLENEDTGIFRKVNILFYYNRFIYKDTHNYLEVIGNIHENKDLLK